MPFQPNLINGKTKKKLQKTEGSTAKWHGNANPENQTAIGPTRRQRRKKSLLQITPPILGTANRHTTKKRKKTRRQKQGWVCGKTPTAEAGTRRRSHGRQKKKRCPTHPPFQNAKQRAQKTGTRPYKKAPFRKGGKKGVPRQRDQRQAARGPNRPSETSGGKKDALYPSPKPREREIGNRICKLKQKSHCDLQCARKRDARG